MPITINDIHQRFLFEDYDIRGEIVSLRRSTAEVYRHNSYSAPLQTQLGEFLAAAALISANLKTAGTLTVQARGDGPVPLLMADCTDRQDLRAIARMPDPGAILSDDLRQLVGSGHLSITLTMPGRERHQGIVPLEHPRLAACLSDYFARSEQLPTRMWLAADTRAAAGLLLQALPAQRQTLSEREHCWEHLTALADTLAVHEQLTLDHGAQLHRLFHGERVRLYDPTPLRFACSCSRERIGGSIIALGPETVRELLASSPLLSIQCQFCQQHYGFTEAQLSAAALGADPTLH
ncbi:MAG: Hsp33 family molecular chaperone HslO [Gammaproteobacteria bacterium]